MPKNKNLKNKGGAGSKKDYGEYAISTQFDDNSQMVLVYEEKGRKLTAHYASSQIYAGDLEEWASPNSGKLTAEEKKVAIARLVSYLEESYLATSVKVLPSRFTAHFIVYDPVVLHTRVKARQSKAQNYNYYIKGNDIRSMTAPYQAPLEMTLFHVPSETMIKGKVNGKYSKADHEGILKDLEIELVFLLDDLVKKQLHVKGRQI